MSRPTRARGLKHKQKSSKLSANKVASYAGAWIETGLMQ